MCSSDDFMDIEIGDLKNNTVHEVWHGEKFNKIRAIHENGNFKDLKACKNCYYPRKAQADEKAVINGRTISIENYINRAQKVGE
tara:strand:- start:157 stop:408 length:252 start_codon:yes stop_codon:yes gene_type:complete